MGSVTIYPKKYAHESHVVVLCCDLARAWFTNIFHGYITAKKATLKIKGKFDFHPQRADYMTIKHHSQQRGKADFMFAPSQWETPLQNNAVSHWLGANIESALKSCAYFM